jgi:hypothetical protein
MAASMVMVTTGVALLSAMFWATAVIALPTATVPMIAWIPTTMPPMWKRYGHSKIQRLTKRELTCDGASWPKGKEVWRRDGRYHRAYDGIYNPRSHVCVKH